MSSSTTPALTYPKPETELKVPTVRPRRLKQIDPPTAPKSKSVELPESWILANQTPVDFANTGFRRSTHVIPAAPRDLSFGLTEEDLPSDKEARQTRVSEISRQLLAKKQSLERGESVVGLVGDDDGKRLGLVNVLDRYLYQGDVKKGGKGVTLVLAHANGFPRRIWEAFLASLLGRLHTLDQEKVYIQELWSFEAVNHGDGAVLNNGKLGDTFNWGDNARDILNFLLHFLPSNPSQTSLPVKLDPIPLEESSRRSRFGYKDRRLVGIGHSLGGCSMTRAAIDFPALFSSLVLVDPVIMPALDKDPSGGIEALLRGAVARRSRWSSKTEALESFSKTPFFRIWDPAVLKAYVEEGISEDPDKGGVKLKQSGFQEGCVFAERRIPVETWELLPSLNEKVHLLWAMSGRRPVVTGPEDVTQQTVWRRPKNSSNLRVQGAGHLIVHEAPEALARVVLEHLRSRFAEDDRPHAKL